MSKLSGVKHYNCYKDQSSGKKLYSPTYRGRDLLLTNFPPTLRTYPTANEAQQHALRHAEKKKKQIKRFNENEEHRDNVLARYSAMIIFKNMELEKQEEGNE